MRARIFLADDHTLLLDALSNLLEPKYEVVGTATDGRKMLKMVSKLAPDLVLMDIAMPNLNGFDAGEKLKKILPDVKLVFLTVNEDPDMVTEAFRIGADGYLLKSSAASELFEAIELVLNSKNYVSAKLAKSRADYINQQSRRSKSTWRSFSAPTRGSAITCGRPYHEEGRRHPEYHTTDSRFP